MRIHPRKFNKEEFLKFLERNNVSDLIINKFLILPEEIKHTDNMFKLDINITWYNIGKTFYNFELNYYSEELVEYLFSSKVFNDIEVSIDYLQCELIANNKIKKS